jgi:hypothetical protein
MGEAMTAKDPSQTLRLNLANLRLYGCRAYVRIQNIPRVDKMAPRAEFGILSAVLHQIFGESGSHTLIQCEKLGTWYLTRTFNITLISLKTRSGETYAIPCPGQCLIIVKQMSIWGAPPVNCTVTETT